METDVVVIGGATTGSGTARDLTPRGLNVTLVEMGDVATGTSGRYHGLLHTGARYVASDLVGAQECFREHTTIRQIVPHAVDDTGGLFVLSPSHDEAFVDSWFEGCEAANIPVREIGASEALRREPLVHPRIRRTFDVLDHSERDGVEGLVCVLGGKLTTFRLMAEKTADIVCAKLGLDRPCATALTEISPAKAASGGVMEM